MARSIAGIFENRADAERAVEDLKGAGFDQNKIGLVTQDKQANQQLAEEHGTHSTEGAVAGGLIGGTAGALLAATGALVIPGVGPFLSAGILATSLVGGAAGWLVGGLAGLGIPREEAQYYEERVHGGATLVTVDATGRDAEARQVLLRDGAEDLQDRGFGGGYDDTAATQNVAYAQPVQTVQQSAPATTQTTDTNDIRVPVYEEELVVGKRQEEEGRVHLHKEVTSEQETVPVTLRREEVTVERVPFTGTVDPNAARDAFQGQDIDVPVMGEEAVVGKQAHEVEEVRLRKQTTEQQQQVSDTVRRERVVVDGVDQQQNVIGAHNSVSGDQTVS
jgi:uncharacterized protein (TIGR02271 family)